MTERFTMDNPNDWGFPITDNDTGKVYSCNSNILMKDLCKVVNGIVDENVELQKERNYFERKKTEYLTELNKCKLENSQLKSEIKDLNDVLARYEEKNEQLKSENKKLIKAVSDGSKFAVDMLVRKSSEEKIFGRGYND